MNSENAMTRKFRILLIPNVSWWIIGEMGKQIIARFGDKYEFYYLPEVLLEWRPDLLHAILPAVDAVHCLNESSIDLFRNLDSAALPPIATWIHHVTSWSPQHQLSIEKSAAITASTPGWKQYIEGHADGRVPVTVVPYGVDSKFFHRTKVSSAHFGIPASHFVVGFVGTKGSDSDGGRKGTDVFLDVIRNAARDLRHLHIVLGGLGWEKELAELKSLGISANATGYIRKSDLPALYSSLDVYLLTSRVEGGPCTVFEAMACETAVLSTRVGAVPDLIDDGVNGYSADVDDREALLAALLTLDQFPERRKQIARAGHDTVTKLSWGSVLGPLEAVYDELVRKRQSMGPSQPGPKWMDDPDGLLRASCAADAIAYVMPRVRGGSLSLGKGIAMLLEMVNAQSIFDLARGMALLRGWTYKTDPSPRQPPPQKEHF